MNVISRGVRNAFRNVTRTISIIVILGLSIGLSLIMLIAHEAVDSKIAATLKVIGNTVTIAPAGFTSASSANNALTTAQIDKIKKLEHITSVNESLSSHVQPKGTTATFQARPGTTGGSQASTVDSSATTSLASPVALQSKMLFSGSGDAPDLPDNFSLPLSMVGATYPATPFNVGASSLKVSTGKAITGTKDSNDVMVGKALANKNNLKIGSTFTAYSATLTVAAIFETDTEGGDGFIIASLPTMQRLSNQKSVISGATATVDSLEHLSSVTAAIKKQLGSSADVTSGVDQANQALTPLQSVKTISLYSLIGSVIAGAVIILMTMIMIVRERRREIGVLKAIGGSNVRIMTQFVCEALTFTVLGTVIGLAIGVIGGNPVTKTLVDSSTEGNGLPTPDGGDPSKGVLSFGNPALDSVMHIQATVDWHIIVYGAGVAILIACIGSALASYIVSRVRPAEVLRSE